MPSTYTTNLGVEKPGSGEKSGTWGSLVNDNMDIVDRAVNGAVSLTLVGATSTLTTSEGTLSDGQNKLLRLTGSPGGTHTITVSPNDAQKVYFVTNGSNQSAVFSQGSGANVTVLAGNAAVIYCDGAGAGAAVLSMLDALAMGAVRITGGTITGITDLAVADGGTGASTPADALTNLGLTATAARLNFVAGVIRLADAASVLADTTLAYSAAPGKTVASVGSYVMTDKEGFSYQVAASAATDQHVTTAGGVKLYVQSNGGAFNAAAFGSTYTHVEVQSAVDYCASLGGGTVFIPPGNWVFSAPVDLPAVDMQVCGSGGGTKISGTAAQMFRYPSSVTDAGGVVVTQHINNLYFTLLEAQTGVQCHQTWTAAGKVGPSIKDCVFIHSSLDDPCTTKSISLQGVWTANISGNSARGRFTPTIREEGGGYFVFFALDNAMSTSIMNVLITNNRNVGIARNVFIGPRVNLGRAEGINVNDNQFIFGQNSIYASAVLALNVVGNIMSDYRNSIILDGCFDWQIVGNSEVGGTIACITLRATATSICERGVISGNRLKTVGASVGVHFINNATNNHLRAVLVSSNNIGSSVTVVAGSAAIRFTNTHVTNDIGIFNNNCTNVETGIDYLSTLDNVRIFVANNRWGSAASTAISNPQRSGALIEKTHGLQSVINLVGGAVREDINITIPAGIFSEKPVSASCTTDATHIIPYLGFYGFDGVVSTATNARFTIHPLDGANILAGDRRFSILLRGKGFAQE
jgi:hypothetical protein